ncbi:MAG TPA: hypothetical protein EYP17_07515 [Candidatus Latescibacteria bacterium]|nr:hypothetical protein [Candidatus Latescibacterota bacterium]
MVNNTGWRMNLGNSPCGDLTDRYILIDWEGMEVKVPPNMDCDGNPTGVGAVELTSEPLPGGTEVDFTYYFFYVGDRKPMKLSEVLARVGERAIVDGDITIELYASSADVVPFGEHWARVDIVPIARIIKGKFDGIHIY